MIAKYMQPIQLYVVFEKIHSNIWLSKKLNINHTCLIVPYNWFYSINIFLKKELFLSNISLIENSAIDLSNYYSTNTLFNYKLLLNKNILLFYNYYNYFSKNKITIFILLDKFIKKIESIDRVYPNSNWLERETSEMYGIKYIWKLDTRK